MSKFKIGDYWLTRAGNVEEYTIEQRFKDWIADVNELKLEVNVVVDSEGFKVLYKKGVGDVEQSESLALMGDDGMHEFRALSSL